MSRQPRTPNSMRVLTVIGNRPQFVKAAAVSDRLRSGAQEVLVHTGQHYDDELSRVFFDELGLPRPDHQLDLGGGTNTSQTARMLAALEPLIASEPPDVVLVYGDTNSTMAGALAGAQAGVPVAHVEAGMRSYDRTMPEELNRVLADHASSLLLCSSERSAETLRGERVVGEVVVVGDVMVDVAQMLAPAGARADRRARRAAASRPASTCSRPRTARATSTTRRGWRGWSTCCSRFPGRSCCRCIPRTRARLEAAGLLERLAGGVSSRGRSATSTSRRCCCTPARCSPTRAACRRRPTWPGVPLRDAARRPRSGPRPSTRAGTCSSTSTPRRRWRRWSARSPAERPALYGDGRAGERVVEALRRMAG